MQHNFKHHKSEFWKGLDHTLNVGKRNTYSHTLPVTSTGNPSDDSDQMPYPDDDHPSEKEAD